MNLNSDTKYNISQSEIIIIITFAIFIVAYIIVCICHRRIREDIIIIGQEDNRRPMLEESP